MEAMPRTISVVQGGDLSAYIPGAVFDGPGFYLTDTMTLLMIPLTPENDATIDTVWNIEQPAGTLYRLWLFEVPYNETLFAVVATAPVRADERTGVRSVNRSSGPPDPLDELSRLISGQPHQVPLDNMVNAIHELAVAILARTKAMSSYLHGDRKAKTLEVIKVLAQALGAGI